MKKAFKVTDEERELIQACREAAGESMLTVVMHLRDTYYTMVQKAKKSEKWYSEEWNLIINKRYEVYSKLYTRWCGK